MPLFTFQCDCGVRFETFAAMKNNMNPQPCPECKKMAPRAMPEGMEGTFNQEVAGLGPQNTGVDQLDAHIDRVIGKSSQDGWKVVEDRVTEKRRVIQDAGVDGHALSRNPDGTYRPLTKEEQGVHERANAINTLAMDTLKKPAQ